MRAGKLDRVILLQRMTMTPDEYGVPVESWTTFATMRAQIVQAATDEAVRERGETTETLITFRMRYAVGVTVADRVSYDGKPHNIRSIRELGRRRGLELQCVRVGP